MIINATITQTKELTIRSGRRHQLRRTVAFSSIIVCTSPAKLFKLQ